MIKKAIIPAAGLGTRFLPATKAQPKEMLPIIDMPTIQYVVQEAVDAGIEDILIVSGKGKRSIEDHFDRNPELESRILEKDDELLHDQMRHIEEMANIHYIRQKELKGLGDAVLYAKYHCGNEPFAVLLGDTIIDSVIPITQQMIDVYAQYHQTIVGVEAVDHDKVSRYGIIGGEKLSDRIMQLEQMIEKPEISEAPSNLAIVGRYILTPEIFPILEDTQRGKGNEVQLTDAIRELLKQENALSYTIEGTRYDIGNKLDFLTTTVEFALKRKEFAEPFKAYLKDLVNKMD